MGRNLAMRGVFYSKNTEGKHKDVAAVSAAKSTVNVSKYIIRIRTEEGETLNFEVVLDERVALDNGDLPVPENFTPESIKEISEIPAEDVAEFKALFTPSSTDLAYYLWL